MSRATPARLILVTAALACGAGAAVALWTALDEEAIDDEAVPRGSAVVVDVAPEPVQATGEVGTERERPRGRALTTEELAAMRTADGERLPVGTWRLGPRRVRTPDGRILIRPRGSETWQPDEEATATAGRRDSTRGGADGDEAREPGPGEVRVGSSIARLGKLFKRTNATGGVTGPGPVIRPANLPGEAPTPIVEFEPADATFVPPVDRRPNLHTLRHSGSRVRRERTELASHDENDHAELDELAGRGLRGDYFDFLEGRLWSIPDLATLPPTFTRIDPLLDFSKDEQFRLPFEPETFAVLWRGYLHVPEPGDYEFTCGSDDGVRVTIGDEIVLEHGGLRPYAESRGRVELAAGKQPIEVIFYENQVFASCRLFWDGPSWGKRLVGAEFFSPPDDVADVVPPHATRLVPHLGAVGDEIDVLGTGFGDQPALNHVTFAGVPAEVVEATPSRLRVRVPVGASSGDVVVQVGPLASLPETFEVQSVTGLFAEYFHIGKDLSTMPTFDQLVPFFVRLEGPLDFHQDHLWNLPHSPDVFASRYTGYVYFPEEDDYRITLGSDDGATLRLDGQEYIAAPGLHSYREVTRTSRFTRGFHPVEITFFENRGAARLRLFWQRASEATRSPIPRGFLFPPEGLVDRPAPTLDMGPDLEAPINGEVTLTGTGFGAEPGIVRVLFPGDVWSRPRLIEDGQLTARVPFGAASGPLRVQVGIKESNAIARFRVSSAVGLTADYYAFSSDEELREYRDLEKLRERTPTTTRVETSLDLDSESGWAIPFPARNFAVHWHGTLGVEYETQVGFLLQADDGAYLFIDGRMVVNNKPFHPLLERGGVQFLSPGEHRIDVYYFQKDGEAKLRLFWNPYGLAEHRDIPAGWFRPDE